MSFFRSNDYGQLGLGHTNAIGVAVGEMGDDLKDVDLGVDFIVAQLVAGWGHNCALSTEFEVKCWGRYLN